MPKQTGSKNACPSCSAKTVRAHNSRVIRGERVRYRCCTTCGYHWKTVEIAMGLGQHMLLLDKHPADLLAEIREARSLLGRLAQQVQAFVLVDAVPAVAVAGPQDSADG